MNKPAPEGYSQEIINEAETLAKEWWNGVRWDTLTAQQQKDALAEAEAMVIARCEHKYDRLMERTQ